jgi:Leucine-rich repeat (LRR) protein
MQHPCKQVLALDSNRLAELPEEIGSLSRLERLSASQNALIGLPPSIKNLKSLAVLRLSKNKFSSIPDQLGACTSLEEIDFSDNYLQVRWPTICIERSRRISR